MKWKKGESDIEEGKEEWGGTKETKRDEKMKVVTKELNKDKRP